MTFDNKSVFIDFDFLFCTYISNNKQHIQYMMVTQRVNLNVFISAKISSSGIAWMNSYLLFHGEF